MSRGQRILEGEVVSSASPSGDTEIENNEDLKQLVASLITQVDMLQSQIEDQDTRTSKWLTSEELAGDVYDPKAILSNLGEGEDAEGVVKQAFFGTDSHPIPDMLLRRYGPKFKIGQRVTIDPESEVFGSPGTRWGNLLEREGCAGRGIIKKIVHLTDSGEWKYQVRVPGLTGKEGDGFRESELLPLKQKVTRYVVEE